jgi:hypothetical protein
MNVLDYYILLFTSPPAIRTFPDFVVALGAMLIPWVLMIWLLAITFAGRLGGRQEEIGTSFSVRFSWAWGAALISLLLLVDILVVWYTDRLNGWQSAAPHCALGVIGCIIALTEYVVMNREVKEMQTTVSKTR